jgi:hypothetical protein
VAGDGNENGYANLLKELLIDLVSIMGNERVKKEHFASESLG